MFGTSFHIAPRKATCRLSVSERIARAFQQKYLPLRNPFGTSHRAVLLSAPMRNQTAVQLPAAPPEQPTLPPAFPGLTIEQLRHRYERATKIVATLGPKSATEEKIAQLIGAGVNVFRLNFSHGSHEEHTDVINRIRQVSKQLNVVVGVLQDLCGPKTRIGLLPADTLDLQRGDHVLIRRGSGPYPPENGAPVICTDLFEPTSVLKEGQKVFLADARFELVVRGTRDGAVDLEVLRGGKLRPKVGIAVPDTELNLPAYSAKDINDLAWGIKHGVDYVALSFVNSEHDVKGLRQEMERMGRSIPIISKIERKGALARIEQICAVSDGVMVARGDLGVDIPVWEVPRAQLLITAAAQKAGIPVIVATQMLTSMVASDQPTRSDISDVFNGALKGADAVMLSEETAIGDYPVAAVQVMGSTVLSAQKEFDTKTQRAMSIGLKRLDLSPQETVALAAAEASMGRRYHAIIVCSQTGESARLVAKYRPEVPVYGVSTEPDALQRMTLFRGVNPLRLRASETAEQERERAFRVVAQRYLEVHPEENEFGAILINGSRPGMPYLFSMMELREITRDELRKLTR